MPKMTPGYAKNTICRALRAVVDPEPSAKEIAALWDHFGNACAYCGCALDKKGRGGHIDHLVPTTTGGTNHISNRVLSCPPCNGDEKRETPWIEFLHAKITDPTISSERRARIEAWMQCNALAEVRQLDMQALTTEMDRAVQAFDTAVSNLRNTRQIGRAHV